MNMQKGLIKFFESKEGEQVIGQIVLNVINHALTREIKYEDGKSEPGRIIEKTEKYNVLDFLCKYLPHIEAGLRGSQADSAKARNRATEVAAILSDIETKINPQSVAGDSKQPVRELTESSG